jgi:FtsP/CotA-like multicopper oxidase with cupredoxin domain
MLQTAAIGPTLRLGPGDRLTVDLINRLDVATDLHTHGLGVSPTSPADDVFARIAPGETRRYEYRLPTDHPSGLFWYHPHLHGDVARQVGAGLVGAIIRIVNASASRMMPFSVEGVPLHGMMSEGSMLAFTIDGRTFDPERVDIATTLGEVEE